MQQFDLGTNFSALDWLIVAVHLVVTISIGLYANRFIADMTDYVVAGRSLKSFISIATMLGTEIGLVTVMYAAQKGLTGGFAAFHIGLVAGIVPVMVGLTGFMVVPLRRMNVMTIPEFYERRFSRGVRILGGVILSFAGILNMGLFLKASAIFLAVLTGLTHPQAVNLVMAVMLVVVLAFTIMGGMVSVVVTDYLQFVILALGMLAACVFAVDKLGWTDVVETVKVVHGRGGFDPFDEKGFGPAYVLWMLFTAGLVSSSVWPTAVMRVLAAKDTKVVKRLYLFSSIGFMTRFIIPQFLGICAMVYLWNTPEAKNILFTPDGHVVNDADVTLGATPAFLGRLLPVGLIGIVAAGMLAAYLSTHNSYLLCWASVLAEDVVNPLCGERLSTGARLLLVRVLVLIIGVFGLVWSILYPLSEDMWDYLAVTGAIYFTGAFAVMFLGIYWKGASSAGAYLALVAGGCALFGLEPVREALRLTQANLGFDLRGEHVGLGTTPLALILMVVGSLVFPDRKGNDGTGLLNTSAA